MSDDGLGLREQKRRATRRALQVALLRGALERGLENSTIDDACRAAQVSGLVVLMAGAVLRHGWSRWVAAGGTSSLGASVIASHREFRDIAADVIASGDPAALTA